MQPFSDKKPRHRAILTEQQAIEIFGFASSHQIVSSAIAVARMYGVNERTVRDIWKQRTWTHATHPLEGSMRVESKKKAGRPKGSKDTKPRKQKQGPMLSSGSGRKALVSIYQNTRIPITPISVTSQVQTNPISGVYSNLVDASYLRPEIAAFEREITAQNSVPTYEGPFASDLEFLSEKGSIDTELHSWTLQHLPWIERVESFLAERAYCSS